MYTKIKVFGLTMAYDERTAIEAARRIAAQFQVIVEITNEADHSNGGWPEVSLIGTTKQVLEALTVGWASGDPDEDAESIFRLLRKAKEVY